MDERGFEEDTGPGQQPLEKEHSTELLPQSGAGSLRDVYMPNAAYQPLDSQQSLLREVTAVSSCSLRRGGCWSGGGPHQQLSRRWLFFLLAGALVGLAVIASSSLHRDPGAYEGRTQLWSLIPVWGAGTETTTTTTTETRTTSTATITITTTNTGTTTTTTSTMTSSTITETSTTVSSTTTTRSTTTTTSPPCWPRESPDGGKQVILGVSYAPVPLLPASERIPNDDFMAEGMEPYWGPPGKEGKGRRDLRIMRALGANTVRLYGNDPAKSHQRFLREADKLELDVIAGLSDYPYIQMKGNCMSTDFDCFDQIKEQYVMNLQGGFLQNETTYHPRLRTVILMNEPDLKLLGDTSNFCRALVSAFDAVIEAEKEQGVKGVAPNFTVAFSFGLCPRCTHLGHTPGLGQMYALREAMRDPKSVDYTPRNDLWTIYRTRFVNAINTANPAFDVNSLFIQPYEQHFQGTPVFIGEYHSPEYFDQKGDLEAIVKLVRDPSNLLLGIAFFEFQVRYDKGGAEMSFGMFGLDRELEITEAVIGWENYPTHCLTAVEAKSGGGKCGKLEKDQDYVSDNKWGFAMDHIISPEMCCSKCREFDECKAFTWVEDAGLPGPCKSQCWVKGGEPVRKDKKVGVVSGLRAPAEGEVQTSKKKLYVHEVLANAFGGEGVNLSDVCPVTTTTMTSTTSRTTVTETQTSSRTTTSITTTTRSTTSLTSTTTLTQTTTSTSTDTTVMAGIFSLTLPKLLVPTLPSLWGGSSAASTTSALTSNERVWPSHQRHIIKAISYDPLPAKTPGFKAPGGEDFMAQGAEVFWGEEGSGKRAVGRRDLRIMSRLGANAVRLYGADPSVDHTEFLDEARKQSLDVIAGISSSLNLEVPGNCLHTDLDCFGQMKQQYSRFLTKGFLMETDTGKGGGRTYHSALRTVVLMNKPDKELHGDVTHFFRALISAFDGVLEAEKELRVAGNAPNLTVTFSFTKCKECAPGGEHPGLGQMLALRGAMREPSLVHYTPRNDLWKFYQERFMNSLDTACDAEHLRSLFLDTYDKHFQGTPVFIAEYHAPDYVDQEADLKLMVKLAEDPSNSLLGISFFEYQVRYDEGCVERSFGMFGLSDDLAIAVADIGYGAFTSWCLTPVGTRSPGTCDREEDVAYESAAEWSKDIGHVPSAEMCCTKCKEEAKCQAWTWLPDAGLSGCPSQCQLKGGVPTDRVTTVGAVSGAPGSRRISYMHKVVAAAFGGPGVDLSDVCPVKDAEGARGAGEEALRSLRAA